MKRLIPVALLFAVLISLVGCAELDVFKGEFTDDSREILYWQDKTYEFYLILSVNSDLDLIGEKIATVDTGSKNSESIFELKGYPKEEWVVHLDTNMMGAYTLYKEKDVQTVPDDLKSLFDRNEAERQAIEEQESK